MVVKKVKEVKMNKNTIVLIIFVVLVLVSTVQAFQLISLKSKLSTEGISISKQSVKATNNPTESGGASLPANIQNLPGMVGGC